MSSATLKKIIPCKKDQLVEMVLDIEKYPEFVPFCQDSKVYEKKQEGDLTLIVADLTIGKGPFVDTYKSCLLYTSPSPRDQRGSRMPSSA